MVNWTIRRVFRMEKLMAKTSLWSVIIASLFCFAFPARSESELPEGNGRHEVQAFCTQCHELDRVTRSGYNLTEWRNNLNMMINVGSGLPKDKISTVAQYLAKNFPEKPKPPAVVIPGEVKVTIKEWVVPT